MSEGPMECVLAAEGVSFSYNGAPVLDRVSFAVRAGEFVALTGANGSGKSTLLRILLGLNAQRQGSVRLFGVPPGELRDRWRIGYVPQRTSISDSLPATVEEVVATGRLVCSDGRRSTRLGLHRGLRSADREAIDHALEAAALTELRRRLMGELSGGERQRTLIAKALVSSPELLILDEPVAGVDEPSQRMFRDSLVHLVYRHSAAVLLVSHELGAVADDLARVLVLRSGGIVFDGRPEELTARGVSLGVHSEDLPKWLEAAE